MKAVVLAVLLNKDGRALLQHKDAAAPNNPNMWCFFSGAVEEGETPESALRRELLEELEVSVGSLQALGEISSPEKNLKRIFMLGFLDAPAETLKKQQHEGDDLGFFSLEEISSIKMNPAHLEALQSFSASPALAGLRK